MTTTTTTTTRQPFVLEHDSGSGQWSTSSMSQWGPDPAFASMSEADYTTLAAGGIVSIETGPTTVRRMRRQPSPDVRAAEQVAADRETARVMAIRAANAAEDRRTLYDE